MEYVDRLTEDEVPFLPPSCEQEPERCVLSEEQEGNEEQAVIVIYCSYHRQEREG